MRTTRTMALLALLPLVILLSAGFDSCSTPLLANPGFDLWCGDELCAWEVEQGSIERVPTWHERDPGVSLVGSTVVLSQRSEVQADCIALDLLADADEGVELTLELDFLDDGTVEVQHPLAGRGYARLRYEITTPVWYDAVRFRIVKRGAGRAVLAQIDAVVAEGCPGEPLPLDDLPDGANCTGAGDCAGGACRAFVWALALDPPPDPTLLCGSCAADADCAGTSEVCGLVSGARDYPFLACVPPGSGSLGERCRGALECVTGTCCDGICAECCADGDCPDGSCRTKPPPGLEELYRWVGLPRQCDPRAARGAPGAACLVEEDCASGSCRGESALRVCELTGERCASDEDCWYGLTRCLLLGQRLGTCD